jgi:NTP pyrophosphatase (non-canonical NTP hydrolase)
MSRLIEEVGELAREVNHVYGEKKKKSDEEPGDIEGEVGDILYTLICFSNANGYLLDRAHWIASWKRSGYDGRPPLFILVELDRLKGIFVGEVARWYGEDDQPRKISILSVEGALGDILRALDCLAARVGFTLDGAIKKTVDKVTVRDKDRFPDGI